jgi:hypothetical protein
MRKKLLLPRESILLRAEYDRVHTELSQVLSELKVCRVRYRKGEMIDQQQYDDNRKRCEILKVKLNDAHQQYLIVKSREDAIDEQNRLAQEGQEQAKAPVFDQARLKQPAPCGSAAVKKKLPPKRDRLPPDQLGKLFEFLPGDYEDPAHPGIPLSAAGRRDKFSKMSAKEMRESYNRIYKADSVRYEKATGYGIDERVSFEPAVVLLTGTRRPKEALARLRAVLSFGVIYEEQRDPFTGPELDELFAHNPAEALARLRSLIFDDTNLEAKQVRRRCFKEREVNEFINSWRLRGFSRSELVTWAAILSEADRTRIAAARRKGLAEAKKKGEKNHLTPKASKRAQ